MTDRIERMRIVRPEDSSLAVLMAQDFAKSIGIRSLKVSILATAVSELVTNIVKYAETGLVTVRRVEHGYLRGIEVLVEDKGPGIADIETAMKDHVSTSGTLGLGLPGTKRMVNVFEISSTPGVGTRVRIVVWA
jgi:serine/threonine-protein kinase RsbT